MPKRKLLYLFGTLLVFFSCSLAGLSQTNVETPQEIISKMADAYAKASSYKDNGVIQNINKNGEVKTALSFETYFARPQKFRFEWRYRAADGKDEEQNLLQNDSQQTYSIYDRQAHNLVQQENLSLGVAAATGISLGAAHTVSALLMKDISGFRLTEISKISLLKQENFEGEDCFVVRGYWHRQPVNLWIGKNDYFLRKVRIANFNNTFQEEIRRNIKSGEEIPSETFTFSEAATLKN